MKKRKPRPSLNRSCSSCGDRPAKPRDGKLACRTCIKMPLHMFQGSIAEMLRAAMINGT